MIEVRRAGEIPTFDTRAEANDKVDRKKRYRQIIGIMKEYEWFAKLTAKDIAVIMHEKGFTPTAERNFAAPRLTELSKAGIVEPCGKTICRYTGKKVAVYRLREEATAL